MTAHQLARILLAGPDHIVTIGDEIQEHATTEFVVKQMWATEGNGSFPVVMLEMSEHGAMVETSV